MTVQERYIMGFDGKRKPIKTKNPDKELSDNEKKLWNLLKNGPKTLLEIQRYLYRHPIKGLEDVSDLDRMLRRLRNKNEKKYVDSIPQKRGPQKWEAIL